MFEWFKHIEAPEVGQCYGLKNCPIEDQVPAVVTATTEGHVEYSIGTYGGLSNTYKTFKRLYEVMH